LDKIVDYFRYLYCPVGTEVILCSLHLYPDTEKGTRAEGKERGLYFCP